MKKVCKKPRITTKRLNTRVHFYKYTENNGPEAGEKEEKLLYSCGASIDGVWLRELEQAISNGTQNDIKLYIRDPQGDYLPSDLKNLMFSATVMCSNNAMSCGT